MCLDSQYGYSGITCRQQGVRPGCRQESHRSLWLDAALFYPDVLALAGRRGVTYGRNTL